MRVALASTALLFASPAWPQARPPAAVRVRPVVEYRLPRGLEARLTGSRGDVLVATPGEGRHAAREGEVLPRGARLRVGRGASAEVTLRNGTAVEFLERSQVVLFASPAGDTPGHTPATTTTLSAGAMRFRAGAPGAGSRGFISVAAGSATVFLGRADGEVSVDEGGRMTRIAVHRGRLPVATPRGSFAVRGGFGRVQRGSQRSRRDYELPPRPRWVATPPERTVAGSEPVEVTASFELPRWRPERWRVELARDEAFRDRVSTAWLSGRSGRWRARVGPGRYFVRVSALDEDNLVGRPSPTASFTIATPRVVEGSAPAGASPGRPTTVYMPEGFHCSLDGMRFARTDAPLRLTPGRPHRVRCASTADGRDAREVTLDAAAAGPLLREFRLYTGATGDGTLGLTLRDAEGLPLPYADVSVTAGDGVAVGPVREAETRGVYQAPVRWPEGVRRARFRFTVNGAVTFEEELSREGSTR